MSLLSSAQVKEIKRRHKERTLKHFYGFVEEGKVYTTTLKDYYMLIASVTAFHEVIDEAGPKEER